MTFIRMTKAMRFRGVRALRLLSAKDALSPLAWGIRPRELVAAGISAESAIQFDGEDRACCRK